MSIPIKSLKITINIKKPIKLATILLGILLLMSPRSVLSNNYHGEKEADGSSFLHKLHSSLEKHQDLALSGYVNIDYSTFFNKPKRIRKAGGWGIRKLRLNVQGKILDDTKYRVEFDASNFSLEKAYIDYSGIKDTSIKLGKNIVAFGLGSGDLTPEEPIRAGIGMITNLGLHVSSFGNGWFAAGGIATNDPAKNKENSMFGRFGLNVIRSPEEVIHGAISLVMIKPKGDNGHYGFSQKPEVYKSDKFIKLDLFNVKRILGFNFDTIMTKGPMSFQAEYFTSKYNGGSLGRSEVSTLNPAYSPRFQSYYLQMAYSLTGEVRKYGTWGGMQMITPSNEFDFSLDHLGAFELVGRYSYMDMNDNKINAGNMHVSTIGLNWYVSQYFLTQCDFSWIHTNKYASPLGKTSPRVFMLRLRANF